MAKPWHRYEIVNLQHYFRKSFFEDTDKTHIRIAWLRLVFCAENILHWTRDSALPPSSLVVALQAAQLDPAIELFYPVLNKRITLNLEVWKLHVTTFLCFLF